MTLYTYNITPVVHTVQYYALWLPRSPLGGGQKYNIIIITNRYGCCGASSPHHNNYNYFTRGVIHENET